MSLGIHVDENSAAMDAVEQSCRRISDQIIDKIYLQKRTPGQYDLRLSFDSPATDIDVKNWVEAFKQRFPEVESTEIILHNDMWTVKIAGPLKGGDLIQRLIEMGIQDYKTEIVSTQKNIIELKVSLTN